MILLESDVERALVTRLNDEGIPALKLRAEGMRGWPDRTILLYGARMKLVELKRATDGKLRKAQIRVGKTLRSMGFEVYQAYTVKEARLLADKIAAEA